MEESHAKAHHQGRLNGHVQLTVPPPTQQEKNGKGGRKVKRKQQENEGQKNRVSDILFRIHLPRTWSPLRRGGDAELRPGDGLHPRMASNILQPSSFLLLVAMAST